MLFDENSRNPMNTAARAITGANSRCRPMIPPFRVLLNGMRASILPIARGGNILASTHSADKYLGRKWFHASVKKDTGVPAFDLADQHGHVQRRQKLPF